MSEKLAEESQIRGFFFLCWVTYFSTYLGRLNLTACLAEMVSSGAFSRAYAGLAGSAFFFAYGIFQLVFGILGDRYDPKKLVFTGVFLSGCFNLLVSVATRPASLILLWLCNGVVQAAVWSPMLRLTVALLRPEQALTASVRYSTTCPLGTFAAYLLSALSIKAASWRAAFAVAGGLLIVIALLWWWGIRRLPGARAVAAGGPQHPTVSLKAIWRTFTPGLRLVLAAAMGGAVLHGLLKDSLQTWMPTMMQECFGLPASTAIIITLVIPLVNLAGVYAGKWANDKVFHNEITTSCVAFAAAAVLLVLLRFSFSYLVLSVAAFALCAALMLSINTMLITLVPIRLGRHNCVSTLSGVLNAATYIGSAASGYGVSLLLEALGWNVTVWFWAAAAVCGMLLCKSAVKRWKRITLEPANTTAS